MSRLSLLRKIKNINDLNILPINSPDIEGVPLVPEVPIDNISNQVSPVHHVKNKITNNETYILALMANIYDKMDPYNIVNGKKILSDIKSDLESRDILNGVKANEVAVNNIQQKYSLNETNEMFMLDIIASALTLTTTIMDGETSSQYVKELNDKKNNLISLYDEMITAYETCVTSKSMMMYDPFILKYKTWYNAFIDVNMYCERLMYIIDGYMCGKKINNIQEDVFNMIFDKYDYITLERVNFENQIYFKDGEYINFKETSVTDDYGNECFGVDEYGYVTMHTYNFTINGVTLESTIKDIISKMDDMKDRILNKVNGELSDQVDRMNAQYDKVNDSFGKLDGISKIDLSEDILSGTMKSIYKILYTDLKSRQSAILKEMQTYISISNIDNSFKTKINDMVSSLNTYWDQITKTYENFIKIPSMNNYNAVNYNVSKWNVYIGQMYSDIYQSFSISASDLVKDKLNDDRDDVVNVLSRDFIDQLIIKVNDSIYVCGENIEIEDMKSSNSVNSNIIYASKSRTPSTASVHKGNLTLYVDNFNTDSSSDTNEIDNGCKFLTLQSLLNHLPDIIIGNIDIYLNSDIEEDLYFKSLSGGNINICMNGHSINGKISIESCSTAISFLGGGLDDLLVYYPVISPYTLNTIDNNYSFTIYIKDSSYVYFKNVKIYGKIAEEDLIYCVPTRNYAIGALSSNVNIEYCTILHSNNGVLASSMSCVNTTNLLFNQCTNYYYSQSNGARIMATVPLNYDIDKSNYICDDVQYGQGDNKYFLKIIDSGKQAQVDTKFYESELRDSFNDNNSSILCESNNGMTYCLIYGTIVENMILQGRIMGSKNSIDNANKKSFWFFGNQFEQVRGKEIEKVVLSIPRLSYFDDLINGKLYLRYHTHYSYEDALNSVTSTKNGPTISTWYHRVTMLDPEIDEDTIIELTDMEVLTGIQNGVIKGFGVYVSLDNTDKYISCAINIKAQIYYKNSK